MKKISSFFISFLMMFSMTSVVFASPSIIDLNVQATKLSLPSYQEWAWTDHTDTVMKFAFPGGFEGFLNICQNYLTSTNLAKVISAQAYSSTLMNVLLRKSGQQIGLGS